MKPDRSRCVYKYFDLADRFLRVSVVDPQSADLCGAPGLTRSEYRRAVIRVCMQEFEDDVRQALEDLYPCDPMAAEDLLYQICIAVNPGLDIRTISLREEGEVTEEARRQKSREKGPAERLRRRSKSIEAALRQRIVGQDEALSRVVCAVRRAAAGLAPETRPMGTFLFVGRTGTGKTELARALSEELFGSDEKERALVRIDCSEYALAHEYSKLIGAPPGYVGHEDGGQLTDAVREKPDCVVLFDEIEKAHPRLHNLLLQILDEGHLTDSKGRRVSFERAFVVLTSNAGAQELSDKSKRLGFQQGPLAEGAAAEIAQNALGQQFSPEFLGRIDETVVFRDLEAPDARAIARLQLQALALRVRRRQWRVAFTPAVAGWVAQEGFSPASQAREIRRVVQREIENPLSDWILESGGKKSRWVRVSVQAGQLHFAAA